VICRDYKRVWAYVIIIMHNRLTFVKLVKIDKPIRIKATQLKIKCLDIIMIYA